MTAEEFKKTQEDILDEKKISVLNLFDELSSLTGDTIDRADIEETIQNCEDYASLDMLYAGLTHVNSALQGCL